MPFKAIIFDLDGTLLDTLEDIGDAMNCVLGNMGLPEHGLDAYRRFVGDGMAMLVTRALPEKYRNEQTIMKGLDAFRKVYAQNLNAKTKPYSGISEMLDSLNARGLPVAILSNKPHEFTKLCVEKLLEKWRFHVVLGQRNGVPQKPDPAGALEIAERLNIQLEDFLYVGDTPIDLKTAQAAGMYPVGVVWGFRPMEELKENGALTLLQSPLEILSLLDS